MKKTVFFIASFALIAVGFTACGGSTEEQTETTPVTYALDAANSELKWKGDYADGSHSHMGTVNIASGSITYNGETFESGSFVVDMKSIKSTDLTPETGSDKLLGHFATADFFNTAEFPNVDVTINAVSDKEIDATLKIAGKQLPAKMPVTITKTGDSFKAKGKFIVDFSSLDLNGFKPNPEMEAQKPNQYTKPAVGFELNLVLKAESAK